jgi:cellulose biosynthesis protein BcsQ
MSDDMVERLRAAERSAKDAQIRLDIWRQYHGAILPVMGDMPDQVKIKRQAQIIDAQAYKIKNQRTAIKHMNAEKRDPLAPGRLPGYNVYRHCAKLRELLLSEKTRTEAAEAQLKAAREALERIADYPSSHAGACPEIARTALSLDTNKGDGV